MAANGRKRQRKPDGFYSDLFRNPDPGTSVMKRKCRRQLKVDTNKLYEVEIIERNKKENRIKVHYVGYSDVYDEWKDCTPDEKPLVMLQKRFIPHESSVHDRSEMFFRRLGREIKFALFSTKKESPEVRLELPIDQDVFETLEACGRKVTRRNKDVVIVKNLKELNGILGAKWDERILNTNGDFAYVYKGTVCFWLVEKKPVLEYRYVGSSLIQSAIENEVVLIFTFVRGDGVSADYVNGDWKQERSMSV